MHINDVIADCNDMRILLSKLKEEPLTYDNVALIKSFVAKYDKQHLGSVLECAQEHSKIEYLSKLTHMICELFNEEIIKIRINEFREYCEKEYGELQWDESLPSNDCYNQYIKITSAQNKYQKIAESHDTTNASKRKTAIAFIGTMQLDCKFNNFQKVIAICKEINKYCDIYKDKIKKNGELEVSWRKIQEDVPCEKNAGKEKTGANASYNCNEKTKKDDTDKLRDIAYGLFRVLCSNGPHGVFNCNDENDLYQYLLIKDGCDYSKFVKKGKKQKGYLAIRSISECLTNKNWFDKMRKRLGNTISDKNHNSDSEITELFDPYRIDK